MGLRWVGGNGRGIAAFDEKGLQSGLAQVDCNPVEELAIRSNQIGPTPGRRRQLCTHADVTADRRVAQGAYFCSKQRSIGRYL